jgi:hypothetical protein
VLKDLQVIPPAERPGVVAIAEEARVRCERAVAGLGVEESGWLAEAPLDWAIATLDAARRPRFDAALATIAERVLPHGPGWAAAYGGLLLLATVARVDTAQPVVAIPLAVWPQVESGLRRVVEEGPANIPADWTHDHFSKDLRAARLRVLPSDGRVGGVETLRPWRASRAASPRQRIALVASLGAAFRPFRLWSRHAWRGYREAVRGSWEAGVERVAAIVAVNSSLDGMLLNGWTVDPALRTISPHLAELADGARAMGGFGFPMPTDETTREYALSRSRTRRELFEAGKYQPTNYAFIVPRQKLLRWAAARQAASRDS